MASVDQHIFDKAIASFRSGALTDAERHLTVFLRRNPENFGALNLLGILLMQLARYHDAEIIIRRAINVNARSDATFYNYGIVLKAVNRSQDAFDAFSKALEINPSVAESWNNRGTVLNDLKAYKDAIGDFEKAIALKPNYAEAFYNLGNTLWELMRFDEALASCDRALTLRPDLAKAHSSRARILQAQGKIDEAIAACRHALTINPDDAIIHSNLIFALNFDAPASAASHQDERAQWNKQHAQKFAKYIKPHANKPDPHRRLRIGYVTSYFRHQAATYAFGGVLLCHDPAQVEVYCYSDTLHEDDVTARLRSCADHWHNTTGFSDDKLAELIRDHHIDILVDLVGHMAGHRLLVFARKPAPIQITAWGEPTGTGLQTMDYLLADSVLVPVDERALLAERVIDLPNFLGYWTPEPLPESEPLPAMARGYITFGSFNRMDKILGPVVRTWATILRAVPGACLVLKDSTLADSGQRTRIEAAFATENIPAARLTLLGNSDRAAHFSAYQNVDIALDPFPHSGGMTTLDAVWMGVPVVTWSGRTISSRLAAACLTAVGLTDFIAHSPDAYVNLAVAKAADVEALSHLRANLRKRISNTAFGDCVRYSRAVESAYREIWQHWCVARMTPTH